MLAQQPIADAEWYQEMTFWLWCAERVESESSSAVLCAAAAAANLGRMKILTAFSLCPLLLAAACAQPPKSDVTVLDYRDAEGAYVLVYSTDDELRTMFEDRLVADFAARDMLAIPSYPDLPDVKASNRERLLGAAKARKAMFVLIVEEVKHGEHGVTRTTNPARITHEHPSLQEFYAHTNPADHEHDEDTDVFVEVSGFVIQGDYAKLIWSGTTWSFAADGEEGRISELSVTIANAIDQARRKRQLGFE